MHLLRKNLILAGIASVAMVGFLGSSSVSALDGFLFSNIINQQQTQREQLLSYLTNPFGASTDCESTNPDSTISCNNLGNPEYAFNYTDRGASLWGYEGKGLVFKDKNSLIRREDGTPNPQLRTGRKGDTVQYSIKVDAERWFDSEETKPFYQYFITLGAEKGVSFDASTLRVSVNGLELNAGNDGLGDYEIWHEDNPSAYDLAMLGMKEGATFINVTIPWINYETRPVYKTEQLISGEYYVFDSFKYEEDSVLEITIDGVIVDDVDENLDAKAIYDAGYIDDFGEPQYPHYGTRQSVNSYFSRNTPVATVLTRSNIVIQRYDDGENPVIGAEYSIDGVTAIKTGLSGVY